MDICADMDAMDDSNATPEDLAETVRLVEAEDRRIVARQGDVRDFKRMQAIFDQGYAQFGRIDIVVANAGIIRLGSEIDPEKEWDDIIDTNLVGRGSPLGVAIPKMIEQGWGGSIVMTSSTAGLKGTGTMLAGGQAYASAKRGLVGLMQVLGQELAKISISCEHGSSHWCHLGHDHEPGDGRHDRQRRPRSGGHAERVAHPDPRTRGDRQRGGVPGLRSGSLHHRGAVPGGRRVHAHVSA